MKVADAGSVILGRFTGPPERTNVYGGVPTVGVMVIFPSLRLIQVGNVVENDEGKLLTEPTVTTTVPTQLVASVTVMV